MEGPAGAVVVYCVLLHCPTYFVDNGHDSMCVYVCVCVPYKSSQDGHRNVPQFKTATSDTVVIYLFTGHLFAPSVLFIYKLCIPYKYVLIIIMLNSAYGFHTRFEDNLSGIPEVLSSRTTIMINEPRRSSSTQRKIEFDLVEYLISATRICSGELRILKS